MKTDSIIFDMDGTLWDGVRCYTEGFNDFYKEKGIEKRFTNEDLFDLMGMQEDEYLDIVLPEFPKNERKQVYQEVIEYQYRNIETLGGKLYPGVREGLSLLSQRYTLFIVSNCARYTIDYFLKWSKLADLFKDHIAHGENYKPKHENINHLIQKYRLQNPVYVGDTASDSEQARLSGIPYVYVSYGFGTTDKYDLSFDNFKDLTNYFM